MRTLVVVFLVCGVLWRSCSTAQEPGVEHRQELTNSIGMKLVLIPKGTFMMGSPVREERLRDNERQHLVTLSRDYHLGVYEVTQAQYQHRLNTSK